MLYWIPFAFLRIVVFFIAGILLRTYAPGFLSFQLASVAFLSAIVVYFLLWYVNSLKRKAVVNTGFTGLLAIFLAGYLNAFLHDDKRSSDHLSHSVSVDFFRGKVVSALQEKENFWKQIIEVSAIRQHGKWNTASGKVLMYFPKTTFAVPFDYGDNLLIKGSPAEISAPKNPGEFDYQKYLSYKNIYHQHFLREKDAILISSSTPNPLLAFSFKVRQWSENKLNSVITGKQEQAIASALVLGIVDGLDNEILSAYAATGAMHMLSVSGLHVAIIYLILGFLIKPLHSVKHGKWFVALISILILWSYAMVTGLSPSVLRAVTMFSFFALAKPLNHRTNIYNTLGASAFCLLVYDPFLLMSVGFQLSYLAVIGIVYLQPLLYRLYEPDNRLLDEVWKISSVSIAAQLATFAIGLLYFHQFPNYFLLSNLFVIPLSFVILVGGLAVLVFSFVDVVGSALGFILEIVIKLLNYLIFFTEKLPFALIENIQINAWQCSLLMLIVVCVILLLQFRKIKFFYVLCALLATYCLIEWNIHYQNFNQSRLTVYTIKGHAAYDLIDRGTAYFFSDSLLYNDSQKIRFHVTPNRLISKVNKSVYGYHLPFSRRINGGNLICWKGNTILHLDSFPKLLPENLQIDYLILSGDAVRHAEKLLLKIKAKEIILDSSNSYFVADKVLNSLTQKYHMHSVWHHGAFDTKL
jgi:competence protein ComEC